VVAHLPSKQTVAGSNPVSRSTVGRWPRLDPLAGAALHLRQIVGPPADQIVLNADVPYVAWGDATIAPRNDLQAEQRKEHPKHDPASTAGP
jgi:hypothetical protein